MRYYILVIFSVFLASLSQMLLKRATQNEYSTVIRQYLNIWVISGYSLLACTLVLNIFALSRGVQVKEISIIESLSYLFVPILSWIFYKEKISLRKCFAISLIFIGIIVFFI